MQMIIAGILIGLIAGILSGILGLGGGFILVPALVYVFGLSQHTAQGTTLALMLPPISLLGVMVYYKSGFVDIKIAILICIGFFIGSLFGAQFAVSIPELALRRIFGIALLVIALRMLIFTK